MMLGPDQSNELSVLCGDDECVSPDFIQDYNFEKIDCTIRVFKSFGAWIMYSCTTQKYRVAQPFSYILCEIQIPLFSDHPTG